MSGKDEEFCDDQEDEGMYHDCPQCGIEYDEIDYDYQICHRCNYNANTTKKDKRWGHHL